MNKPEDAANPDSGSASVDVEALQSKLRFSRTLNVVLAALVVFLGIVVLAGALQPQAVADGSAGSTTETEAVHVRADPNDPLAIGDINAPVVLSEWTDYRCPFCSVFATQTLPTLMKKYVDTGKLRIEFNDVYFFGDQSRDAAIAARAAAEQGYYLEYIQVLYAAAPDSGHPDLPREKLIDFAREANVPDLDSFVAALDSPELAAAVDQSHQQAMAWGISGVPFFVIGKQVINGAQPLEIFEQIIDAHLNDD